MKMPIGQEREMKTENHDTLTRSYTIDHKLKDKTARCKSWRLRTRKLCLVESALLKILGIMNLKHVIPIMEKTFEEGGKVKFTKDGYSQTDVHLF